MADPETGTILDLFVGTAINMEGLGDGTFEIHAISHDLPLAEGAETLAELTTLPKEDASAWQKHL